MSDKIGGNLIMTADSVTVARPTPRLRAVANESPAALKIRLLSGFTLVRGDEVVELPLSVQRLVIFLSLQVHPLHRPHVAGTLWPDTTDQRASANLRSALWRLNQLNCPLIKATGSSLQIAPNVTVDLRESSARAHELLRHEDTQLGAQDELQFCFDLLPDWYDDWLVIERERFHQLRLRALELICERLTASREYARALEAVLAAVAAEPLRESAHRALMKVHLAEGNRAEAFRQFQFYRQILQDELGLAPSVQIIELLRT
jgi:DNA-binding SARP family transcriptional activator